ncbi:MAG: GIY-YIG nuclease family protein [Candidatus Taylorbacteria bacterium]|nr:GIY-YIG nuclease family protein [Candidatus Taylorbacteria bacterium]
MYYVYILTNPHGRKYTGFSEDLKTRIHAHQSKGVKTTKNADDMKLTFYAAFMTTDATLGVAQMPILSLVCHFGYTTSSL